MVVFTKVFPSKTKFLVFPHCALHHSVIIYGKLLSHFFGKNFVKELIWRNNSQSTHCGNCRNLLSHFFGKNFVKVTWLLKNLLELVSRIFFWVRVIFTFFHNMQSNKNCWISIILKKIIGLWRAMKMCSILQFHKKSWSRYSTIWKLCTYICMYVKVTFLLKKLLKNWFDKNSFR